MQLDKIIEKSLSNVPLDKEEAGFLMSLSEPEAIGKVMAAAGQVRKRYFGDKVFLYGFVYYSTYCVNNCSFCFYRKSNHVSPRYRKSLKDILEISTLLVESGVHLVDLTSGEDPQVQGRGEYDSLLEMVREVKKRTGTNIMVSPGVVPDEIIHSLSDAGADWYALYQETYNKDHYEKLRLNQSFSERIMKRKTAREAGMLVEDGILLGVGETSSERAASIYRMCEGDTQQVRVMSFVPQKDTPLENINPPERTMEYLGIAVMRLLRPDRLIPATLDVEGIGGLKKRLEAGANVVTSIIPPKEKLAGVAQSSLDVEQGLRSVPEVCKILNEIGLAPASEKEFTDWIQQRKKNHRYLPESRDT